MPLIDAYDKRTGERVAIPERWLGSRLGAGYSRHPIPPTPKTFPATRRASEPQKTPDTGDTPKEK